MEENSLGAVWAEDADDDPGEFNWPIVVGTPVSL